MKTQPVQHLMPGDAGDFYLRVDPSTDVALIRKEIEQGFVKHGRDLVEIAVTVKCSACDTPCPIPRFILLLATEKKSEWGFHCKCGAENRDLNFPEAPLEGIQLRFHLVKDGKFQVSTTKYSPMPS